MDTNYYKNLEPFFGSWNITRLIGEGSFGKVFEIEREDFGRVYKAALKAITIPQNESEIKSVLADGMDMQSATTYYKGFVEEVVDEFALMAQLKGNSNIVSYEDHAVIEHKDGIGWDILIRMELLTPLLDYTTQKQMTQDDILKLGIDICKALEYCKAFNIIHRDIKPENIFISPSGDYKLGDFGIARTVEKTTSGMSKKGTYTYMAPEVYKGQAYGSSVDIYSLGIVLYRLVNNNRAPFLPAYPAPISHSDRENSITRRIGGEPIPMPTDGDERLGRIILKACAYAPEYRYDSPEEMRKDLEAFLAGHPEASFTINPSAGHVTEKTAQNPALLGQPQESLQPQRETQPQSVQSSKAQTEYGTDKDATVFLFGDNRERPNDKQDATVLLQPEEGAQAEPVMEEKKKSKKTLLLIGGGVVAAAVVIGIAIGVSRIGGGAEPSVHYASSDSNTEDTADQPESMEADTALNEETEIGEQEPAQTVHEEASETVEDGAKDAETGREVESARKLYDLLAAYDEIHEADGIFIEIPNGPITIIQKLMRTYNAEEDIKAVSLAWGDYEDASIRYMDELQEGEPMEYTYLAGETESGEPIILYINTEKGIYYVGTASGKLADGIGTVYYNVKIDELTGLVDYYAYDGMWMQGRPVDAGEVIHVYDEIVSGTGEDEGKLVSRCSAYWIDQNGRVYQFYDVYNNEGGREMETSEGDFEEYESMIPTWELGEY